METLKERLIEFIDSKGMSRRSFLLSCGFSESYLNNISKGISYDAIEKIKSKYPELSMPWLVLGVSLEVLEYSIGQSMKRNRPIFNYVRIMRTHADAAMRMILDNLKDEKEKPGS